MSDAKKPRGFACLSPERRKEIATMGGKTSQAQGRGHRFSREEAKVAGQKGGISAHALGVANKFTPETAAAAGRIGGNGRRKAKGPA